jgi:hypothetical protein
MLKKTERPRITDEHAMVGQELVTIRRQRVVLNRSFPSKKFCPDFHKGVFWTP